MEVCVVWLVVFGAACWVSDCLKEVIYCCQTHLLRSCIGVETTEVDAPTDVRRYPSCPRGGDKLGAAKINLVA